MFSEKFSKKNFINLFVLFLFKKKVWFQNRRSKERKGKPSKDKDDDDLGDDSQPSPPPTTSEPTPMTPEI